MSRILCILQYKQGGHHMAEVAVNSPQRVRLVLVGNIEFLEYLKKKYGNDTSISYIIENERGLI